MEATSSSETSVDFQRTTRRYIPEDGALHNHPCENLKFYIVWGIVNSILIVMVLSESNWYLTKIISVRPLYNLPVTSVSSVFRPGWLKISEH
jgi:hypothetical protein